MDELKQINERIETLKNDFENGSTGIAMQGLKIFCDALSIREISESNDKVIEISNIIVSAKPAMASLNNIIANTRNYYLSNQINHPDELYKLFLSMMSMASSSTLDFGFNAIFENAFKHIITCSYSSTVMNLFEKLNVADYDFKVFALESVWQGRDYSHRVAEECKNNGIECRQLRVEELNSVNIDCGITGVDSVIPGQGAVNGIPSKQLAEYLVLVKKPFYVIAESFKLSNDIILEDGFEFISIDLIKHIITDKEFI